ncbi:hypothetical protein V7S43_016632 [Phytophthora oleae]|uniref:Uncharacterized protein n=1 Tax=Phytophthora oleae TaxID=2107226 RepID=A0ABD3EWH4_9STRA
MARATDFGEEGNSDTVVTPTSKRRRVTVVTGGTASAKPQKKRPLSEFYIKLTKVPQLHGKAPVAALQAEELAELAAAAESEPDDDGDEDYEDTDEDLANDDAEDVEATTPPATPLCRPSPKQRKKAIPKQAANATGKGKKKRIPPRKMRVAKRVRT